MSTPSHTIVAPHDVVPHGVPLPRGKHCPVLQPWHCVPLFGPFWQGPLQHTLSTQNPLTQAVSAPQGSPRTPPLRTSMELMGFGEHGPLSVTPPTAINAPPSSTTLSVWFTRGVFSEPAAAFQTRAFELK